MRLFIAVWPPEEVVDQLLRLDRPQVPGMRWTTRPQWHVTLRFLGEVVEPDADALSGALADALGDVAPAEVSCGPASAWFPGRRVLQLPVEGLGPLAVTTTEATAPWGRDPEQRPFHGHLTLARVRGGAGPKELAGAALEASWRVAHVTLVSSRLSRHGAKYRIRRVLPLRG